MVIAIVIGMMSSGKVIDEGSTLLIALLSVALWTFVESLLLSTIGTTPGKWLLNIRLIPPRDNLPDFPAALGRSLKVYWRGYGIGFPFVSAITSASAYFDLKKQGTTSWDREEGFRVVHKPIGPIRGIVAVLFLVAFFALAAY
jgi:hypothetical protein